MQTVATSAGDQKAAGRKLNVMLNYWGTCDV